MSTPLAVSMRPRTLDEMIGAEKLVKRIRARMESGRIPKAWMFAGQTGCGKTSVARIVALSLQCRHADIFGAPCSRCRHAGGAFDITELNMPDVGAKELREILDGVYYTPKPGSRVRVYILDEAHMMSKASQNVLLKYTEDCPRSTVFFTCTTEPGKIIRTLRRRHKIYTMPDLQLDGIKRLVKRGLRKVDSELNSSDLVERLMEKNLTSPGLILNAVENYVDGFSAEEACEVDTASNIDTKALCRSVIHGDWEATAKVLMGATSEDVAIIKASVSGYINTILLGENGVSHQAEAAAKSILTLNLVRDEIAAVSAALYKLCKYFNR